MTCEKGALRSAGKLPKKDKMRYIIWAVGAKLVPITAIVGGCVHKVAIHLDQGDAQVSQPEIKGVRPV